MGVFLRYEKRSKKNALAKFILEMKNGNALKIFYNELGNYKFEPYNALAIKKSKDKFRPLLIPSPKDRLIFDSLYPRIRRELLPSLENRGLLGLGLVEKQSIEGLLNKIYNQYITNGYTHVLTLDFSSFFSKINRDILFKKLENTIGEKKLNRLLKLIIYNKIENYKNVEEKTGVKLVGVGIPQGLSFSPLLACYYATDVDDEYIKKDDIKGFRYIDDIIILSKSISELKKIYSKIDNLSKSLDIDIHKLPTKGKTEIINLRKNSVVFLGAKFTFKNATIPEDVFAKFFVTCKEEIFHFKILERKNPQKIKEIYFNYVKGWLNFYKGIYNNDKLLVQKLNKLLFENYFKKKKNRLKFYQANPWVKIDKNKAPFK